MDRPRSCTRVRTAGTLCKRPAGPTRLLLQLAALTVLSACSLPSDPKTITMTALESAPLAAISGTERITVSDPAALRQLCKPLGPRLGLLQVRSAGEWDRLVHVAPQLGPRPDSGPGMLVGLACWAGTPVDGRWPVHIDAVRVCEGAGLLIAEFVGGSYLPDGTARLETAHVSDLAAVLVVDVNGTTFYIE